MRVESFEVHELDVPLTVPFMIAGGGEDRLCSLLVQVKLDSGITGLGEAAPLAAYNGETVTDARNALQAIRSNVEGRTFRSWRGCVEETGDSCRVASARCAFEVALLDAFCRRNEITMWSYFGGRSRTLSTDITIPILPSAEAFSFAKSFLDHGFRTLKFKISEESSLAQLAVMEKVHLEQPDVEFCVDANAGFDEAGAVQLLREVKKKELRLRFLEQPLPKVDLDGMARLRRDFGVILIADESAVTCEDVARLYRAGASDGINLKLTKSGVFESLDMAALTRAFSMELMIGGMLESDVTMSASAAIAGGLGIFHHIDLDTPLFMKERPYEGRLAIDSAGKITLNQTRPGHGISLRSG